MDEHVLGKWGKTLMEDITYVYCWHELHQIVLHHCRNHVSLGKDGGSYSHRHYFHQPFQGNYFFVWVCSMANQQWWNHDDVWHEHSLHITGPLWGETTSHQWIHLMKANDSELGCLFLLVLTSCWTSRRIGFNFRRHHTRVTYCNKWRLGCKPWSKSMMTQMADAYLYQWSGENILCSPSLILKPCDTKPELSHPIFINTMAMDAQALASASHQWP